MSATLAQLVDRARTLVADGRRAVLGITGPPAAGKTTLAEELVRALGGEPVAHVPMDGFHLADVELDRLGRRDRKGAPDTFDAAGYAALLRRLHEDRDDVIYAPAFERDLEQPVAGSIPVPRGRRLGQRHRPAQRRAGRRDPAPRRPGRGNSATCPPVESPGLLSIRRPKHHRQPAHQTVQSGA